VEIFDVSLAPLAGSECASMAPWRSYDVPEEVPLPSAPRGTLRAKTPPPPPPSILLPQAAATCWQPLPDTAPPCVLLSMMSGAFHSIHIRPEQVRLRAPSSAYPSVAHDFRRP
jgi:hypothetical protein